MQGLKHVNAMVNETVVGSIAIAFRHSTRNASRVRQKVGDESDLIRVLMGTECLNTKFSAHPAMCEI